MQKNKTAISSGLIRKTKSQNNAPNAQYIVTSLFMLTNMAPIHPAFQEGQK